VLEPLAAELDAQAVVADLSEPADLDRLIVAGADADLVIANAALPASGLLTEFSQAQIDTMIAVNLRAPIALARAFAPGMTARGRGHLIFISSLSANSRTAVPGCHRASAPAPRSRSPPRCSVRSSATARR
jgi:short-subunit dehydrogenase